MSASAPELRPPARAPLTPGTRTRRFNRLVGNPVLEDYALRYAPTEFRRWSTGAVAVTALGGIAYMADQAIGGSLAVAYGITNASLGILAAAVVIFLTGVPIATASSRHNLDIDLLTRGAGFGYLGSTLTSVIYASFTFIFFALEGSIMAQALLLFFGWPLWAGYLVASLAIIPLVVFGMTLLARLQAWTQPVWMILLVIPPVAVLAADPASFGRWLGFGGISPTGDGFGWLAFGSAAGIALSLIAQIGEQADYLRFMPDRTASNRTGWWIAVLLAGPGWIGLGVVKQLMGTFFASVAMSHGVPAADANQPIRMYVTGFGTFLPVGGALAVATFFVVLSQIKINVTNAYSGSLSWSNFFSRLTHRHPGRVVYIFLNVGISLALMEADMFALLGRILGFYSNVAVAWIGAVAADLVVVKAVLGIGPSHIEFRRAYLHPFNPAGFGAMLVASAVSIAAFFGAFGAMAAAFSSFVALGIAFALTPLIAIATGGRFYLARPVPATDGSAQLACVACGFEYEARDTASCPFHAGTICSLCCSLEAACHDMCKRAAGPGQPAGAASVSR